MNFFKAIVQMLSKLTICLLHLPNWLASLITLCVLLLLCKCLGIDWADLFEYLRDIETLQSTKQSVESLPLDTLKV